MKKFTFLVLIFFSFQFSYSQNRVINNSSGTIDGVSYQTKFTEEQGTSGYWTVYLTNNTNKTVGVSYNATYYQRSTNGLIKRDSKDGFTIYSGKTEESAPYYFPDGYGAVNFAMENFKVEPFK